MDNEILHQRIIEEYQRNGSVGYTAEILNVNKTKVRRVLITHGLWSSKTSREIGELHNQGLTVKEIAAELCLSEKAVQTYLPYTRVFKSNNMNDAQRCKNYRTRKESAVSRQVSRCGKGGIVMLNNTIKTSRQLPKALKIHLELDLSNLSKTDKETLHKYAGMEMGISRDIIVPTGLSLHALHYVIQRAFGWQNCHMHNFGFPREVFDKLTRDDTNRYFDLCGVYFRFPDGDIDALFYDDDYTGDVSLRSWLKSKYIGPEYSESIGDLYYENQIKVDRLKNSEYYVYDSNLKNLTTDDEKNRLLERLTLLDFITLPGEKLDIENEQLEKRLRKIASDKPEKIERWKYYISTPDQYWDKLVELQDFSTIRFLPQCNTIEYFYDYGDDWKVLITCTNAYYEDYSDDTDAVSIEKVINEHRPICVKSDGGNLPEDVGGISGFVDFLRSINGEGDEEFEELIDWASERGWNDRKITPEKLL